MRATLIFEGRGPTGASYQIEISLGFFALAWLLKLLGS